MATASLNIVDIRRIAAAHRVTEQRLLRAAEQSGAVVHRINGRPFVAVDDEDRIAKHLSEREGKANA